MRYLFLLITLSIIAVSCGQIEHSDNPTNKIELTAFGMLRSNYDAPASPNAPTLTFTVPASSLTNIETELHQTYWVFTIYATHNEVDYVQTVEVPHVFGEFDLEGVTELENENDLWTQKGYFIRWQTGSTGFIARIAYNIGSVTGTVYSINLSSFSLVDPINTPIDPIGDDPVDPPVETPVINDPQIPIRHSPRSAYNFRITGVEKYASYLIVNFQNLKNRKQGNTLITRAHYEVAYQTDQQKQNGVSLSWKTAAYDHESSFGIYHLKPETLYHIHLRAKADTFNEVTSASGKIELETSTTARTVVVTYIVFVECEESGIEGGSVAEQHAKVEHKDGKIYLHSGPNGNYVNQKEIVAYKKGVLYADLTEEIVALMEKHENACD